MNDRPLRFDAVRRHTAGPRRRRPRRPRAESTLYALAVSIERIGQQLRGRSELVAALRRLGIRLLPARPVAGRWIIRGLANVLAESEPHEAN